MRWHKADCVEKIYTWFIQTDITENIIFQQTPYSPQSNIVDFKKRLSPN